MSNQIFQQLPKEVQDDVKNVLEAYDKVHVTFEQGEYKVSTGIGIYSSYTRDYEYIGEIHSWEAFTEEEQILNYFNSFHSFPVEYSGDRDWNLVNEVRDAGFGDKKVQVKMLDGNIVRA